MESVIRRNQQDEVICYEDVSKRELARGQERCRCRTVNKRYVVMTVINTVMSSVTLVGFALVIGILVSKMREYGQSNVASSN